MLAIEKSEVQWRKILTPEQYAVLRQKQTELPFSGEYVYLDEPGIYNCAACGAELFDSDKKFGSDCGWPNFYDAKPGAVQFRRDDSHGMVRMEVICSNCGGHLGHCFEDSPEQPTGARYCVNSLSLKFMPKK